MYAAAQRGSLGAVLKAFGKSYQVKESILLPLRRGLFLTIKTPNSGNSSILTTKISLVKIHDHLK